MSRFSSIREALEMSVAFVAERLGMTQKHLESIENGQEKPSDREAFLMSELYGVAPDELTSEQKGVRRPARYYAFTKDGKNVMSADYIMGSSFIGTMEPAIFREEDADLIEEEFGYERHEVNPTLDELVKRLIVIPKTQTMMTIRDQRKELFELANASHDQARQEALMQLVSLAMKYDEIKERSHERFLDRESMER